MPDWTLVDWTVAEVEMPDVVLTEEELVVGTPCGPPVDVNWIPAIPAINRTTRRVNAKGALSKGRVAVGSLEAAT